MKRRPITLLAAAAAAATLVVAAFPSARADGIVGSTATYRLTSTQDIPVPDPNANAPQVVAEVVPPGTVVPPKLSDGTDGSPLTILKSSSGFDANQLIVALKDGTSSTGAAEQLFGLSFFGNGFSKGGKLDFSLNLGSTVTSPPQLQSLTPGVTIAALDTTPGTGTGTTTSNPPPAQNSVPEPVSVVLWSAVVGVGLLRARQFRRRSAA